MESFLIYIEKGGIIFTSLFVLSIVTVAIVTLKIFEIYFLRRLDFSNFYSLLIADKNNDFNDVRKDIIVTLPKSKQNIILSLVDLISSNNSKIDIEKEIDSLKNKEFKKIYSFLPSLEVISQVSPLVGLLGTVIGMIDSFNELELGGSLVDPSILAGGIWTALLTTAMGLIVAIPALVSHYFLEKKINDLFDDFEILISKLSTLKWLCIKFQKKKNLKINIIPLIDIIFLMLVFFMLATNFTKNNEVSFSVNNQKQISNQQNKDQLMILYLKDNKIFFEDKTIKPKDLENKYFDNWDSQNFDKIMILNDKKSSIQILLNLMDLIKKNKIKSVNFSDAP